MNLLEIYKERNRNQEWFDNHFSLAEGKAGRMFEYVNTNFRKQDSFMTQFSNFLEIENIPREQWSRQEHHGQEIDKHRVVNMIQSKLFKKDTNGLYARTTKGIIYGDFINQEIPEEEKWLINYIFLLNGYYGNRKNYIIYRTKEDLLGFLLSVEGIREDLLISEANKIVQLREASFAEILRSSFFYIHSFYDDSDFLINYFRATDYEKEELASHIEENHRKKQYSNCCISSKYRPGGNFNIGMLLDESKVFLLTLLFVNSRDTKLNNIYNIFIDNYNENIHSLNKKLVFSYLTSNKNVFNPIFEEILEIEDAEIGILDNVQIGQIHTIEADRPEKYIDETSDVGRQKIKTIYSIKKKQAKIQSKYKCALEIINNCRPIYFKAKTNEKNYLELHHLIPREFRNDFSYSIEVLANYIPLCPRCHRQIHFAVDGERKNLINALYAERKNRLQQVGLEKELEDIYEYYKID
jgi:hypothetical protein